MAASKQYGLFGGAITSFRRALVGVSAPKRRQPQRGIAGLIVIRDHYEAKGATDNGLCQHIKVWWCSGGTQAELAD
jgi:hypothetical protein